MSAWNQKVHPVAEMFPMIEGNEYAALVESIKTNGLRESAWLASDGTLLDGRNRVRACDDAGVRPRFRVYKGDDHVSFIVAMNIERRHLNAGQRACLAVELEPAFRGET